MDTLMATGADLEGVLRILGQELGMGRGPALEAMIVRLGKGWVPGGKARLWPGLPGLLGTLFTLCQEPLRRGELTPDPILKALANQGIHPLSLPLAGTGKVGIARMVAALGLAEDPLGQRIHGQFASSGAELRITGLTELAELPQGLYVDGNLNMGQTPFRRLPEGLRVSGTLHAPNCPNLETLPASLTGAGGINLRGCPALKSLPAGLAVWRDLTLAKSTLAALPAGLEVRGILDLRGCASWDRVLPADTQLPEEMGTYGYAYRGRIRTDDFPDKDGVSAATYRKWMASQGLKGKP
jgi:hypothetical protein